jgi:hypothetical protein
MICGASSRATGKLKRLPPFGPLVMDGREQMRDRAKHRAHCHFWRLILQSGGFKQPR